MLFDGGSKKQGGGKMWIVSTLLFYGGLICMGVAVVVGAVALLLFRTLRRRIWAQLDFEYGKKDK
jgi:hypothetical protein